MPGWKRIEEAALYDCPNLKRVIIPGVKIVALFAFAGSKALTYIECDKLETIGHMAFMACESLSSINLPSAKIVEGAAFCKCEAITDVKFGKQLEPIGGAAFGKCPSLERITIPLKNGLFADDNIFNECGNLKTVDLIEGAALRETIAVLLLEEWRNDMDETLDAIDRILPIASAGDLRDEASGAIREWIALVLNKIIHYKAEHRRILNDAASTLQLALPSDMVMNYVLPFLELPSHTFEGEEEFEDDGSNINNDHNDESLEDDNNSFGADNQEEEEDVNEGRTERQKTTNNEEGISD